MRFTSTLRSCLRYAFGINLYTFVAKRTLAAIAKSRGICLAPTTQLKLTKVSKDGNNILAGTHANIYARRGGRK